MLTGVHLRGLTCILPYGLLAAKKRHPSNSIVPFVCHFAKQYLFNYL